LPWTPGCVTHRNKNCSLLSSGRNWFQLCRWKRGWNTFVPIRSWLRCVQYRQA